AFVEVAHGGNVQLLARRRHVAGGGTRKNTTAGREDRVRRVGNDFHDDLTADAVCLANPPDDQEFGRRHEPALFGWLFADRHGARLELGGEARLVTRLEHTGLTQERAD